MGKIYPAEVLPIITGAFSGCGRQACSERHAQQSRQNIATHCGLPIVL
jgi:hypothetical protein